MLAPARPLPSSARPLPSSPRSLQRLLLAALAGVVVYGIAAPLLAVAHELIVLATAHLASDVVWLLTSSGLVRALPLDPIYTGAMLMTLGGIEPRGLALAGPVGAALHATWPLLFESPTLVAPQAWASAVVEPGATIVSRWLCSIAADASMLGLGLLAVRQARPGRGRVARGWLAVVGAIVQAHVVVTHLVDVPPELADVEAAGVPFAIAMIVSGDVQGGPRLAESLTALGEPLRGVILGLGMVFLAYLPVLGAVLAWNAIQTLRRWSGRLSRRAARRGAHFPTFRRVGGLTWETPGLSALAASAGRLLALGAFAFAVAVSPLGDLADAQTRFLSATLDGDAPSDVAPAPGAALSTVAPAQPDAATNPAGDTAAASPASTQTAASPAAATRSDAPSIVAVAGSGYRFQYTVNGVPQVIRGIGYNVRYRDLPPEERARRLDSDFARLRAAGVNTVFGWEPAEFDEVLLDTAHRHDLGVAPPFDLDPDAAYADPAVRARITAEVLSWVERYRAHPALRMWAIGNEVLHKLVYPSWMPLRSDPAWEQRARDFTAFYVELIDKVRAADPHHPIVHRDAEDAYLTWLRDEMLKSGRRPWFIYGVNAYTPRLGEILAGWPNQGWDVPLLVSEFAPGGMSPADRPEGFRSMWKTIRSANGWVLGGAVYAWTTDGPEEVDRVFGLVDSTGTPVDGALAAVGAFYRGVARQLETERTHPGEIRDERVWAFARAAIQTIQAGKSTDLLPAEAETSIMGDVGAVSREAVADADLIVERVRDPRRVAWARDAGVTGEWWISWLPPTTPDHKLTFVVQQRDGRLGVRYIYHGPR